MVIVVRTDEDPFLESATLARYAAEGAEISLVVATSGPRSPTAASNRLGPSEVVSLGYAEGDLEQAEPEQVICELVAHIRRVQPHIVITSGPHDAREHADRLAISQLATAAVMRAPDPRFGHTCCSRRPHAVSKLYHTAGSTLATTRIDACAHPRSDTYYRVFSMVNSGRALETDLFDGLRRPPRHRAVAA